MSGNQNINIAAQHILSIPRVPRAIICAFGAAAALVVLVQSTVLAVNAYNKIKLSEQEFKDVATIDILEIHAKSAHRLLLEQTHDELLKKAVRHKIIGRAEEVFLSCEALAVVAIPAVISLNACRTRPFRQNNSRCVSHYTLK